jgi:hypothetical protein
MRTRTKTAITVAALAVASALFIGTPGAVATQGQAILAGQGNTETSETVIAQTGWVSLNDCLNVNSAHDSGLVACGAHGLIGFSPAGSGVRGEGGLLGVSGHGGETGVAGTGTSLGVWAWATSNSASATGVYGFTDGTGKGIHGSSGPGGTGVFGTNGGSTGIGVHGLTGGTGSAVFGEATGDGIGVYATSKTAPAVKGVGGPTGVYGSGTSDGVEGVSPTGDGVLGRNTGSTGIGVHGLTGGTGSAVFGQATTNGVGINGTSATGLGVLAASTSGTALQVNGKAKFSRSGIVTVSAGTASKTVSLSGVSGNSMVFAMAQQNPGVYVKAAIPGSGSFTIYLTGNAPGSGLKVAYFVLN